MIRLYERPFFFRLKASKAFSAKGAFSAAMEKSFITTETLSKQLSSEVTSLQW
jgi:hypothetical protein